jgi:hypothetical protein
LILQQRKDIALLSFRLCMTCESFCPPQGWASRKTGMPAVSLICENGCGEDAAGFISQARELRVSDWGNLFLKLTQEEAALLTKPAALGLRRLAQITRLRLPRGTVRTEVENAFTSEMTILGAITDFPFILIESMISSGREAIMGI